jgi:translation initiation factor IF-3
MGIKPLPEALWLAREADMDLVEVAPGRDDKSPPVCKVLDYGRWRFEEDQRAKESRRKATTVSIKEMRYRPKIAGADFDTKTRKVADFLSQGHKVKVTIMFRWRETAHPEFGRRILDRIAEETADIAKVEAMPKLDGRNMTMVLAPEKKAPEKKAPAKETEAPKGARKSSAPPTGGDAAADAAADGAPLEAESPNSATPEAQSPEAEAPETQAAAAAPAEAGSSESDEERSES